MTQETLTTPPPAATPVAAPPAGEPSPEPVWLDPAKVRLFRSPRGQVCATIDDNLCHLRVAVRRLRPLTDPHRLISLWAGDAEEIGILEDTAGLDADSAALMTAELGRRYFVPVIRRVLRVRVRSGVYEWTTESAHGRITFFVQGLHQNIRQVPPARLLITDVRGNRYDIPDVHKLDAHSFALIQRHL